MQRTYRFRVYPTHRQAEALERQLSEACDLYNAALQHRRTLWRDYGESVGYYDQCAELTQLRAEGLVDAAMNCDAQRSALRRLDYAFQNFFRRVKAGEKPGYPRYRSKGSYDSLVWGMKSGCKIRTDGKLAIQAVGALRVRWHRPIPREAKVKKATIKRGAGRWYVCFVVELPMPDPLRPTGESVGIDLGITNFATLSNGEVINGPRAYQRAVRELIIAQRRVARRRKGSDRRQKAVRMLARKHEHERNVRRDHAHKAAYQLISEFDTIAVEKLNVRGLVRGKLSKQIADQGWSSFVKYLHDKAEWAGREVIEVDPRYTSQECSKCGKMVIKTLAVRIHRCECGYKADRDHNAAINILNKGLGQSLQAQTVGAEVHVVA